MRIIRLTILLGAFAFGASALPILWTLQGVTLSDGGTATGSFVFDADAGTPCSTHATPCGQFSSVHIVTTNGSARTGSTYTVVCGTNVPTCTGVSPDSTEVLLLTSNAANQTGLPAIAFFFTGFGAIPPQGLSDIGGSLDISNSSGTVGAVEEANCADAACSGPAPPIRVGTAGHTVSGGAAGSAAGAPALSTWGLLALGVLLAGLAAQKIRTVTN